MMIADVMKTNVVTILSTTSLAEARRIMTAHNIRRLPVVDRQKLVGIVTRDALDRMGPSQLTTFSVNELIYMLNKITVKDVMSRDVVTVAPETTIEESVALAQTRKVGSLVIVEDDRVVGIATTNDIFLGILNPLLGIGKPGSRIVVINCFKGTDIQKVLGILIDLKVNIINLFVSEFPCVGKRDLFIHLDTEDTTRIVEEIQKLGFTVVVRKR
ncbi:MAG: CBS domain-containing protein [Dehalococcoidales bacterium]|nr:CBS domain-containing protein [Dehalococcoidales bacterium]